MKVQPQSLTYMDHLGPLRGFFYKLGMRMMTYLRNVLWRCNEKTQAKHLTAVIKHTRSSQDNVSCCIFHHLAHAPNKYLLSPWVNESLSFCWSLLFCLRTGKNLCKGKTTGLPSKTSNRIADMNIPGARKTFRFWFWFKHHSPKFGSWVSNLYSLMNSDWVPKSFTTYKGKERSGVYSK